MDSKLTSRESSSTLDITPAQDGGVLKEIKVEGLGANNPLTGDKVFVHYVGKLQDGTQFDSSRDRGEKFKFDLGKGQVIKGWDIGVASMRRGEVATITCREDYAYGVTGSPPKIPPQATLVFEIELFDWKGEDLTSTKDGGVTRSILQSGNGYQTPNDGAACEIHLKGILDQRVFEDRTVAFTIGDGNEFGLVEGVEIACKKMKKGERSHINVSSIYAYGAEGNSQFSIPPSTNLTYEISMKSFEKAKEAWEMDAGEKLEQAAILKEKGTSNFKKNSFKKAIQYYKKIVDYLDHEDSLKGEEQERRRTLLLAAHLNLALCYIRIKANIEAKSECDKAIGIDEKNEKAYFRRGTAKMNIKDYEDAISDFKIVLTLDGNNKAAKNQITIATQKIKLENEKEKNTYAGMFQKFANSDKKKAADETRRIGDVFNPVSHWSNEMAKGMMSIEQEMAAFGEKMPEPKYGKTSKENQNHDENFYHDEDDL